MDFVFVASGLMFLLIWLWFAFTLNGIYSELKQLNRKLGKQIEFLDYMVSSNVFDQEGEVSSEESKA